MSRRALPTLLLGAGLLAAGPAGVGPSATYAQGGCLPQSEARAAVSKGEAQSFARFHSRLAQQGQVVSSCLARRGNGYVYQGTLVQPNGQVVPFSISAN